MIKNFKLNKKGSSVSIILLMIIFISFIVIAYISILNNKLISFNKINTENALNNALRISNDLYLSDFENWKEQFELLLKENDLKNKIEFDNFYVVRRSETNQYFLEEINNGCKNVLTLEPTSKEYVRAILSTTINNEAALEQLNTYLTEDKEPNSLFFIVSLKINGINKNKKISCTFIYDVKSKGA